MSMQTLLPRLNLLAISYTLTITCTILYLVLLPFRLLQRIGSPRAPAAPPKVSVITHEQCSTHPTPKDTILLVHGFPDSPDLFDAHIAKLTTEGYRCLVAALPGSHGESVAVALDPPDVAELILDAVRPIHQGPLTVVGHDWGAFYTLILLKKYPDKFRRAVLLDVGSFRHIDPSAAVSILVYQSALALMYYLGHPAGTLGVRVLLAFFHYNARPLKEITTDMCYPYAGVLRFLMKKALKKTPTTPEASTERLKKIPHLFVYGKHKPIMFHDQGWVDFVRSTPGGQVVEMPCGHWLSIERPEECNLLLTQWCEKSEKALCEAAGTAEETSESMGESATESTT